MGPKKKSKDDSKKKQENAESLFEERLRDIELEKMDLNVQNSFLRQQMNEARNERSFNVKNIEEARDAAKLIEQDYMDVLRHQQSEIQIREQKRNALEQSVEELKSRVQDKEKIIAELKETNQEHATTLSECECLLEDKQKLEQLVKSQSAVMEKQVNEIQNLVQQKNSLAKDISERDEEIAELRLKAEDRAELSILFDEVCFIKERNRLTMGDVPVDRCHSALCISSSGDQLVLIGGDHKDATLSILDLKSLTWTRLEPTSLPWRNLHGHSACSIGRSKIITYGGVWNGQESTNAMLLNTDTSKCQNFDMNRMILPLSRTKHSSCTSRDRLFLFGGLVNHELSDELWMLDLETLEWKQLVGCGDEVSPRFGASICASEDGRKLYVFGGNDGTASLNDLFIFDIDKLQWNVTNTLDIIPQERFSHVSSLIGHYLIIAGGIMKHKDKTGFKNLGDIHVLDLTSLRWEMLQSGSWISNFPWIQPESSYMALNGRQLIILKPDGNAELRQIAIYDFLLPDEVSHLRNFKRKETHVHTKLEIIRDVCLSNSIKIEWVAPTKNADRLDYFKLMLATLSGTVKSVYQGKSQSFHISQLKPNANYILCLKAVYDDGSFLWSNSKSYQTKILNVEECN